MQQAAIALRGVTFFIAIFAALVAMQLYNLIKAGELAQTWRSFIVAALVFAAWALADFADAYVGDLFADNGRMDLVLALLRVVFVLLFAGGLWVQRQLFYHPGRVRPKQAPADGVEMDHDDGDDDDEEPATNAVTG